MLPPQHRLRSSTDFSRTVKSGKRAGGRYVVVHVLPESTRGTRVGFVVSKAVGNAVNRNQLKRRLRHAIAELLPHIDPAADVVVRALPRAREASFADLRQDLRKTFRRIGVMPCLVGS